MNERMKMECMAAMDTERRVRPPPYVKLKASLISCENLWSR